MNVPRCARTFPRAENTGFGVRRTPTAARSCLRLAAERTGRFRRYIAARNVLASSEAATNDQEVSEAERRRSPKRAVAPTTLVVWRQVVGRRLQWARPRESAERTVP